MITFGIFLIAFILFGLTLDTSMYLKKIHIETKRLADVAERQEAQANQSNKIGSSISAWTVDNV